MGTPIPNYGDYVKYEIFFEIKGLPKLTNVIGHSHWTVKYRNTKLWKKNVWIMCIGKKPSLPLKKALIRLKRHSSAQPDFDNLANSFKPILDGLKEAGIIEDDGPDFVKVDYCWMFTQSKMGRITVHVQDAET